MNGLLFTGGEGPGAALLDGFLKNTSVIVAADSGYDLAADLGIVPDLVVGDMDSVKRVQEVNRRAPASLIRFPRDKDETDTEIGLRLLREMGCTSVVMAGGGGGRLDHLLGILRLFDRAFAPRVWFTAREHVQRISGTAELPGFKGQTVSFFPLGDGVSEMYSEGLKWPLTGMTWVRGDVGISNLITSNRLVVSVGEGSLLMVRTIPPIPAARSPDGEMHDNE